MSRLSNKIARFVAVLALVAAAAITGVGAAQASAPTTSTVAELYCC
ncbi:hypothetical protein ACWDV4_11510 [Micromonospora sp. NPDC003197]